MTLPYLNDRQNQLRLSGQTETLNWPRLQLSESEAFHHHMEWYLSYIGIGLAVVLIDAFRMFLLAPYFAVMFDMVRWACMFRDHGFRRPQSTFLCAPATITWFLAVGVPALASVFSLQLWAFSLIVFAGWRILVVTRKLHEHYLDYAIENPRMSVATRRKWQRLRKAGFPENHPEAKPSRELSEEDRKQFQQAKTDVGSFRDRLMVGGACILFVAIFAFLIVGIPGEARFGTLQQHLVLFAALFWILPPYAALGLGALRKRLDFGLKLVHRCLLVWCHSPADVPDEMLVPWSPRSRFGNCQERVSYLRWNVLLISALILPVVVFYPIYANDMISMYDTMAFDAYPISGSKIFLHLKVVLLDYDTPLYGRLLIIWGTFCGVSMLLVCTWSALLEPSLRAAETLFEGADALEQEQIGGGNNAEVPTGVTR